MSTTTYAADIEKYHALATLESSKGYTHFLDYVTVDAQPDKMPFRHIAEAWQWERSKRAAPALDHLAGIKKKYTGPKSFWNGYHKGSDKTHDDARELCWLLGWSKRRLHCYVCAGKEEQAALITTAMEGILLDNPWIAERIKLTKLTGESLTNGSTLTVLPMNAYTGQGIFPDYVIASEVTHWMYDEGKKFWEFILESVNKRPNCVLKVETNAGMKGTWQWDERNRISVSKFWSFYEAPVGMPLATWMNQEKIDDDSQGLTSGERDRLYKNRWIDPGEEQGYLTEEEALACRDISLQEMVKGNWNTQYFAVLDYGGVRDRCCLTIMHVPSGELRAVVDRMDCWQGTHEHRIDININPLNPNLRSVEGWIEVVKKNFNLSAIILDPTQLEALAIQYERLGMRILRFEYRGGKANHRLAQLLKTCVQNRRISWSPFAGRLPDDYMVNGKRILIEDNTLEREMSMLITKRQVWGYRIDHESGRHDDRCVCLGMGLIHAFPEGVPNGPLGITVIQNEQKTLPMGSEPSYKNDRANAALGNWNLFGTGGNQSAWERGDIS